MDLFMMWGGVVLVVVTEGSGDTGRWRERGIRSDHPSPRSAAPVQTRHVTMFRLEITRLFGDGPFSYLALLLFILSAH